MNITLEAEALMPGNIITYIVDEDEYTSLSVVSVSRKPGDMVEIETIGNRTLFLKESALVEIVR